LKAKHKKIVWIWWNSSSCPQGKH